MMMTIKLVMIDTSSEQIGDKVLKRIDKLCQDPEFDPDYVAKFSVAARCLCLWVSHALAKEQQQKKPNKQTIKQTEMAWKPKRRITFVTVSHLSDGSARWTSLPTFGAWWSQNNGATKTPSALWRTRSASSEKPKRSCGRCRSKSSNSRRNTQSRFAFERAGSLRWWWHQKGVVRSAVATFIFVR